MMQLPIAFQAYSLREIYEKNPLEALKLARNAGYDGVEFYGNHFQPEFYTALLQETHLVCAGWHTSIDSLENDFDNTLRRSLAVGNHFLTVPWFNTDTAQTWREFAARLNAAAERLAPYAIRLGYHNHAHEMKPLDGTTPWEIVADNTLPQLHLQLDTGNAAEGGCCPLTELKKYPRRARTVHLKPYSQSAGFVPAIGEDDTDWEAILDFCEHDGATEWLVVEYEKENPVDALCRSLDYLRTIRPR